MSEVRPSKEVVPSKGVGDREFWQEYRKTVEELRVRTEQAKRKMEEAVRRRDEAFYKLLKLRDRMSARGREESDE